MARRATYQEKMARLAPAIAREAAESNEKRRLKKRAAQSAGVRAAFHRKRLEKERQERTLKQRIRNAPARDLLAAEGVRYGFASSLHPGVEYAIITGARMRYVYHFDGTAVAPGISLREWRLPDWTDIKPSGRLKDRA